MSTGLNGIIWGQLEPSRGQPILTPWQNRPLDFIYIINCLMSHWQQLLSWQLLNWCGEFCPLHQIIFKLLNQKMRILQKIFKSTFKNILSLSKLFLGFCLGFIFCVFAICPMLFTSYLTASRHLWIPISALWLLPFVFLLTLWKYIRACSRSPKANNA